MDEELKNYLAAMEARIIDQIGQRVEQTETRLLTEFHKWASPVETRMRTHRAWFYEVDAEVESLKSRIEKLEGGKNA